MKFLLLVLTTLTLTSVNAADVTLPVRSVYDGDTIRSDLPALPIPLNHVSIRLMGIDAPELHGQCDTEKTNALLAKAKLQEVLVNQPNVVVKDAKWDKYGSRIDGRVFLNDGTDVAGKMIESGLVRPYTGGARASWCK